MLAANGEHREKVSVSGGMRVSPTNQRLGFYCATEPAGFYTPDQVIEFLRDLLQHLRGQVVVVWDRGNNHKGPLLRKFLSRKRRRTVEMLPPWAPASHPAEAVWSWLQYGALAHFTPEGIDPLAAAVIDRLVELKFDPELLRALWDRSKLPFPKKRAKELYLPAKQ